MAVETANTIPVFDGAVEGQVAPSTMTGLLEGASGVISTVTRSALLAQHELDPWEPIPRWICTTSTNAGQNTAYFQRIRFTHATAITSVKYAVAGTSAGNVDIGLYTSADNGVNLTRVASTGSTAAGSANTVASINLSYTPTLGTDYWMAFATDSATLTVFRNAATSSTGLFIFGQYRMNKASSFPLPSTATSFGESAGMHWIAFAH